MSKPTTTKADRSKLRGALEHPSGRVVGLTTAQRERLLGLGMIREDGSTWSRNEQRLIPLYVITMAARLHLAEIIARQRKP